MGFWFRFGNLKIRFSLWEFLFVLGRSHVLWCSGMGPLAYCCSNCLPTMYVLYDTWIILNRSCWHSRFSAEPCVFLWLCYRYYLYRYWLVRLCFISAQLSCRGCVYALFDWKIEEVLGFCSHYLYHSSLHMHSVWGLALFYSMVDCEWYWNCLDGFVRWISVYQTRTPGDTNTTISFKCLIGRKK